MSWLRIESTFVKHHKIQRLADKLGSSKAEAGWFIMQALSWFSQFCPVGQIAGQHRDSDARALEDFCGWAGQAGQLITGLIACALLDEADDGGLAYHDWPEYQGKVSATAEKERVRKAKYRAQKAAELAASLALSHGTSDGTNAGRPALRDGTGRDETKRSSSYEDDGSPSSQFYEWFQEQRVEAGWVREKNVPSRADLAGFLSDAAEALSDTPERAVEGLKVASGFHPDSRGGWSRDRHWIAAALPWAGFVAQWHRHVFIKGPLIDRSESQEAP